MNNVKADIIPKVADEVRKRMKGAEGGHDWWHVFRVWQVAKTIVKGESADLLVVELAALLHDIADPKFYGGDEEVGPRMAREILNSYDLEDDLINKVVYIIRNISFKNSFDNNYDYSVELKVVQDADRLDAIGAIGVARAFNYGGFRNSAIFDPDIKPEKFQSKEEYKNSDSPTINHFYEKLLLLKEKMNTETGKRMAIERHAFLEEFLARFHMEWEGDA
ncbi:HD domain-containing protein [Bacteroidota bacterium]